MAIINHFPCRIPTDLSDATAVSSDIKKDKTGYTGEGKIPGNITIYNNSGLVYSPSSSYNTSISLDTGYYDGPKVGYVTSTVENSIIKYGQRYSITSNGSTLKSGTGTFTNVPSSGQSKASASNIVSGYSGFVAGNEVKGSLSSSLLNPYPVSTGVTFSKSGCIGYLYVNASPSSGTGSSASTLWIQGYYDESYSSNAFVFYYNNAKTGQGGISYGVFTLNSATYDSSTSTVTVNYTFSRSSGTVYNRSFQYTA